MLFLSCSFISCFVATLCVNEDYNIFLVWSRPCWLKDQYSFNSAGEIKVTTACVLSLYFTIMPIELRQQELQSLFSFYKCWANVSLCFRCYIDFELMHTDYTCNHFNNRLTVQLSCSYLKSCKPWESQNFSVNRVYCYSAMRCIFENDCGNLRGYA